MQPSPSTTLRPAIALMEKTPQLLETMLERCAPDALRWTPAPTRWSISEVLAHFADSEDILAERVRRFVLEDTPNLKEYQPSTEGFAAGTPQAHLSRFAFTRPELIQFLRTLPPDAGARTPPHSKVGLVTFEQMPNEGAPHDLGHVRQ